MLRRLRIENLVLIGEAELELAPGLNAITGETGAGKTILAQAIGLLLGSRGDAALVGAGGEEAYVEAELDLPDGLLEEEPFDVLAELRPEGEEGLVLARRVFSDGRARAYTWGRAAARDDVAAVAERLIAMSGQFEQRRLARGAYQLDVLDAFCGDEQLRRRTETREAWRGLQAARRRFDELRGGADAAEARLAELRALVEDTLGMEAEDEESLRAERERLRHVTELERMSEAKRRFRCASYEELLMRAAEAQAELDALEDGADPLSAAAEAVSVAEQEVNRLATELRTARAAAAEPFAEAVAGELEGIGMGEGEFRVELAEREERPTGVDAVAFLIRPNQGLPFAPVAETASGGELSRIALAIAAVAGGETMIFDEIDAGIGGTTAHAVADTLRRLAERVQVVTITHLPQIASVADRHFRVEKVAGDPTHTRIEALDADDRRDELERMLGGADFLAALRE